MQTAVLGQGLRQGSATFISTVSADINSVLHSQTYKHYPDTMITNRTTTYGTLSFSHSLVAYDVSAVPFVSISWATFYFGSPSLSLIKATIDFSWLQAKRREVYLRTYPCDRA